MDGQDGDNDDNTPNDETVGAIGAALQDIQIRKFSVEPRAILIGGGCVVSWHVVFAENVDAELHLNGAFVTTIGTKHFQPTQSTIFKLSAVFPDGTERGLTSTTVRVDPVDCQNRSIGSGLITNPFKQEFDRRFSVPGKVTLRDNGSIVSLGDNRINIAVPVEINVPDWFDANLDLAIELSVRHISTTGNSPLSVAVHNVNFEVDWSFLENLASLGCGHLVELGMSQLGQVLMENMIGTELAPRVTGELNKIANAQRDLVRQQDPQQRPHQFTSVAISPDGLNFRLCPA
ncbi:hypothetical protein [Edaphobacter aggregans]|uniref:hypothetical protein n=1 Tax=Edaphobacter aggregans TaxID=570835 RepID=UPI000557DA62|nr:hypothetical protein [Edaphobacter aggregans]